MYATCTPVSNVILAPPLFSLGLVLVVLVVIDVVVLLALDPDGDGDGGSNGELRNMLLIKLYASSSQSDTMS